MPEPPLIVLPLAARRLVESGRRRLPVHRARRLSHRDDGPILPGPCQATAEVASAPAALGRPSSPQKDPAAASDPPEPGTSHVRGENREHHGVRANSLWSSHRGRRTQSTMPGPPRAYSAAARFHD